jgi:phosphatidate phosphatase APP1
MADLKRILAHFAHDVESEFDRLKYRLAYRFWGPDPLCIVPYRGFGTRERVVVRGRVLEEKGIRPAQDEDSVWRNLLNTYRRLQSDEVPHARVRVRLRGEEHDVLADEEGHFDLTITPREPLPAETFWHEAELELLEPRASGQVGPVRATADVLVPSSRSAYGVISDIDDTVVRSDAMHLLRMARTVFLGNSRTRLPFAGAAALYRAFQAGAPGSPPNPMFYVSNGPVNLHDLLEEFLALQKFPERPVVFLRNWGLDDRGLVPLADRSGHKLATIVRLLETYPELPFILIGDSGERDPEIYAEIVRDHGRRIRAVFIRDVGSKRRPADALRDLAAEVAAHGSMLVMAETSLEMAEFAVARGWIDAKHLPDIGQEKAEDEAAPSVVEELLGQDESPPAPGRPA